MKKIKFQYTPVQYEILCSNMEYRFKIVPKGRRLGLTTGMAFNLIDNMLDGNRTYLWGDVTLGNIRRYVDRIIVPRLRRYNIPYKFNRQDFTLELGNSICDFRSADRPENWEGFGYDKIYLNEAGIILRNEYLWDNAIRMMLLDNDKSEAVIAGTPKGNRGKFPELWEISQSGNKEYWGKRFTTYDNPLLSAVEIEKIANELPRKVIRQEIYGEFVSAEGALFEREWFKYCDIVPNDIEIYMAVDLAISQKTNADYTAIAVLGRALDGKVYIIDVIRDRLTFNDTKSLIINIAQRYNPKLIGIETVAYQAAILQDLIRETALPITALIPESDKVTRAYVIASRYEQGLIYHNNNMKLLNIFEDELLSFPDGQHDDMVDAVVYAFNMAKQNQNFMGFQAW